MKTTKFETGNVYEMRFVTDAYLIAKYICVKRTDKTVTFERFNCDYSYDAITKKIKVYNNAEYIVLGNYSMAPSIKSTNLIK
jgi:hypothetical protein